MADAEHAKLACIVVWRVTRLLQLTHHQIAVLAAAAQYAGIVRGQMAKSWSTITVRVTHLHGNLAVREQRQRRRPGGAASCLVQKEIVERGGWTEPLDEEGVIVAGDDADVLGIGIVVLAVSLSA